MISKAKNGARVRCWARSFAAAALLAGAASAAFAAGKTVRDQAGRTVVVPDPVRRAAVVNVSLAETLLALDAWDLVSSVPETSEENKLRDVLRPPEKLHTSFSDEGSLNLESLVRARPDVVLTWVGNTQMLARLEGLGLPAVAVHPKTLDETAAMLGLLGETLGRTSRSRELSGAVRELAAEVGRRTKGAKKVSVLWVGARPTLVYGSKWLFHDLIDKAGAVDVSGGLRFEPWVSELSLEHIVRLNPDVIIIGGWAPYGPKDLLGDRRWAPVAAVRNGRVFQTPAGRENLSPYAALMLVMTAHWCHPDRLPAADALALLEKYHQEFYRIGFSRVHPDFAAALRRTP